MSYMRDKNGNRLDTIQVSPVGDATAGAAQRKQATGTAATVVLTGNSLAYGQDLSGSGTLPAANGATQTRSSTPPPEQLATQSNYTAPGGAVTVVNQGYPGDRSAEAVTRWVSGVSGDLEIIWLDTNDGANYGGYASGTLTDAQTSNNLGQLIARARSRSAEVVVVGGAPVSANADSRKIFASALTERTIAERMGARYVDAGELLAALPKGTGLFTDSVHGTPNYYAIVGARLAALLGPKGVHPPAVAPGRTITPREQLHVNGTLVTRTGAADGAVWQLSGGASLGIPVDVQAPCLPVARMRIESTTIGYGFIGAYYNLNVRPPHYAKITAPTNAVGSGGAFVHVPLVPLTTPGPDTVVIRAEAGTLEIDSIAFLPLPVHTRTAGDTPDLLRHRALNLHPVGGKGTRTDVNWDGCIDRASGISTRTGQTQTGKLSMRWMFDVALGPTNSGVLLAQSVSSAGQVVENGYMIYRSGTSLIVRKIESGTVTDSTIATVFAAATGVLRQIIELAYDGPTDTITIYVDGTSVGTIATPAYTFLMAGLVAGGQSGTAYAAGTGVLFAPSTAEGL